MHIINETDIAILNVITWGDLLIALMLLFIIIFLVGIGTHTSKVADHLAAIRDKIDPKDIEQK